VRGGLLDPLGVMEKAVKTGSTTISEFNSSVGVMLCGKEVGAVSFDGSVSEAEFITLEDNSMKPPS
jgi:hypothetical protein